ncbi:MAG TPA: hypothetical protein DIC52_05630 [Candidatus Latescibacteria bacterium]|nr:hypothetical protein [Candidatus Latescibacterota bacterium]
MGKHPLRNQPHHLLLVTVSILMGSGRVAPDAPAITLVEAGTARFIIVHAERSARVGEAIYAFDQPKASDVLAGLLAEYTGRVSGAEVRVFAETAAPAEYPGIVLHLGATARGAAFAETRGEMEEDEFFIAFPDPTTILITGSFQHGIEWGTYEFIERFLGVRWLFAGELGTHIPETPDITVPRQAINQKPAYLTRAISFDNGRSELTDWSRLSRLRRRIRHGHYLGVLVHPGTFLETHPEFYPVQGETRARPIDPLTFVAWQPCFTAPGIAETIAPHVARFIRAATPPTSTISLGVNDNGGHCECARCVALDGDGKTPSGLANRSESYYTFCNALAAEVHRHLPDRHELRFGLLAYSQVSVPPKAPLHPSLVPFITLDRMLWADPETRRLGHALNEQWQRQAHAIGWYDYIYGKHYSLPRVYFHTMQEYLSYGSRNDVEHYYAEAYIADDYREGPKYWLTMKLLWNPELDVETALDEWYAAAVGPQAAPYLKRYFARWERFWTAEIHASEWFQDMKESTYCQYSDTRYFAAVSRDLLDSQMGLLQATEAAASSALGRKRARMWITGLANANAIVTFRNALAALKKPGVTFTTRQVLVHDQFDGADTPLEPHRLGGLPGEGWSTWKSDYSKASLTIDAAGGYRGGALLIDKMADAQTPSPTGTVFMRRIPVRHPGLVRLTLRARAEHHAEGGRFDLTFRFQDDNSQWVDFMALTETVLFPIEREGEWQELSAVVPIPAREEITGLMVHLGTASTNSGKFWFDEIRLEGVE